MTRLRQVVYISVLLVIAGWLLVIGKNIFIPVVAGAVAVFVFVGLTHQLRYLMAANLEQILQRAPTYQLNLSPLAILISLAVWSDLWGIAGAFLAVPITAVIAIICSEFLSTRSVAVLLSQNGKL